MFWSFVQPTTVIDDLFNQEDLQLETLLEEDDLLQECKAHNSNLIRYFSNPEIIKKLLNYITNPPEELDELKKLKYSYLSCEILSCDIWPILDAIMDNTDALVDFWKFVDRDEPLEIFQASYFCKVNLVLLQYKLPEMLQFIREHPDILSKILKHISSSPIAEILLKLISISDREEANGIIEWLQQEKVIPNLVSRFDPYLDDETHTNIANTLIDINSVSYTSPLLTNDLLTANIDGVNSFLSTSITNFGGNALVDELKSKEIVEKLVGYMLDEKAPNSTSSLIHGTTVIIDLIRRYCGINYINGQDWNDYINNSLQETKNRDCQALGGQRPNNDTITNISFGYQPQDFEYDNQEESYRLTGFSTTGFGDEEDDMNEFDMNEFESMISSGNNNRNSPERFFENSSEDEMDSSEEEEDWINGLDNQDKLDNNLLGQSEWTADFSDFDNHVNGGSLDDQDKLNDWANFDEAFSPDKINAVNISTSSNDSRDENTPGIDKENILADLDNNNIVDTLNNLSLDEKESKNTNDEGNSK
ncbi:hypothetical protein PIROE2DRAFT_69772 [Piromyces sp. E2]|nr:hypothetical protein PIROE2DRAFT_69772 [Piromyces sp. E2]|eukprot:OUM60051.1 hypothetical protein PIROE2DRAFT_69772 [Piromyces sp. E2]